MVTCHPARSGFFQDARTPMPSTYPRPFANLTSRPRCVTTCAVSQPSVGGELTAAASCPYTAVKQTLQRLSPLAGQLESGAIVTPGPSAFSLDSLADVGVIFTDGIHEAMLRFSQKYGPVSRFANPVALNGAAGWVFVNSPDDVQHICAAHTRNYSERYLPDIYKYITHEKGILGSSGDYNRRHRKLVHPPFRSRDALAQFSSVVVDRSQQVADAWLAHGQAFRTDVAVQTQRLTLDIVGLVAFSHDFQQTQRIIRDLPGKGDNKSALQDRLLWAVNTFGEVLGQVFITPMPLLRLMDALGASHLRKLNEAVDVMREAMLGVIQERRDLLASGRLEQRDLLDVLLLARDEEGRPMTDLELFEDVHDVMGAGHETTATTAAAALYCISVHPGVEAKLLAELHKVLGGRPPSYADLERLPYLSAVIKEVLRLYPAIPVFPRQAEEADTLPSGHAIKAGDVVFMSSYALGRSPSLWRDPLRFDPERFSPENEASLHRYQWLPFGAGPRMCLGSAFAQMSVSLMVATLLQRLQFRAVHPTSQLIPVAYDITMNYNRTNGLAMEVSPRD